MKYILLIALVSLSGTNAFASKASEGATQGAIGTVDPQNLFTQPAYITKLNRFATFEFGGATLASNPRAEGGFVNDVDGHKYGVYLGHKSTIQTALRGATFRHEENPIDLFWGMGNLGVNLGFSSSEDKTTSIKQGSTHIGAGYLVGDGEVALTLDNGTAERVDSGNTDTFKMKSPFITASYLHRFDKFVAQISYGTGEAESVIATTTTATKYNETLLTFNHKPVDTLYYGFQYSMASTDVAGSKTTTTKLPFVLGVEKDAASWLVLRASISQNVLVGGVKADATPNTETKNPHDTTIAAGTGMKFNNLVLDGILKAGTNGTLSTVDMITNMSLTYWF